MNTIESAFILIDRATGPIRGIRRELKGMKRDALEAGAAIDAIGGPRNQRNLDHSARSMRTYGNETRRTSGEIRNAERDVGRLSRRTHEAGVNWSFFGKMLRLIRWPALIAGVGGLTQAIGGLAAGVVGLLPQIGNLAGVGAAAIPVFVGLGSTMLVTKLATSGLSQAMHGNKRALAGLTPEARGFLQVLKGFHPEMQKVRATAQRGMFPGLTQGLRDLRRQMPAIRQIVGGTARNAGGLASWAGGQLGRGDVMPNLIRLSGIANTAVTHLGHAAFYLADAFAHVGVGAGSMTDWLGRSIEHWAKVKAEEARVAEETGRLDRYFGRVRRSVSLIADVGRHTFDGLRGLMHAATGESVSLWQGIDKAATRFDHWANSVQGQVSIRQWFKDMQPVLHETVGLMGDLAKSVGTLSTGPEGATMLHSIRQALPDLVKGVREITSMFGPVVIDALGNVVKLLADVTGSAGPLTLFVRAIGTAAGAMDDLVRSTGIFGRVVATVVTAALFLKFSRIGRAVGDLSGKWRDVTKWTRAATTAAAEQEAVAGAPVMNRRAAATEKVATAERDVAAATAATMGPGFAPLPRRRGRYEAMRPDLGPVVPRGAAPGSGLMPLPVRGVRGRVGAFFRGAPQGLYDPETGRFISTGARGARFGGLGARGVLGGASGFAMRGLGAAGRFFWPIAALGGLIGATQGTGGGGSVGLLRNIASGASFGAIPGQEQQLAKRAKSGFEYAMRGLTGRDAAGIRTTSDFQHATVGAFVRTPHTELQATKNVAVLQKDIARDSAFAAKYHGDDKKYMEGIVVAERRVLDQQKTRLEVLREQSRHTAENVLADFERSFGIRARAKGLGPAMKRMTGDALDQLKKLPPAGRAVFRQGIESWGLELVAAHPEMRKKVAALNAGMLRQLRSLGPAGRRGVAQNMLSWAREQARQNPKLWGVVHDLNRQIVKQFRDMGMDVHIVNGRILTGSTGEWKQIRQSMTSQTEKAREEVSADFTAIQNAAVGSLQSMGYSRGQARKIVAAIEKHGAGSVSATGRRGQAGRRADTPGPVGGVGKGTGPGSGPHGARGRRVRLPGQGRADTVPMVDGGWGAPGELLINDHTERDLDLLLGRRGAVEGMVKRETRPHGTPAHVTGGPPRGGVGRAITAAGRTGRRGGHGRGRGGGSAAAQIGHPELHEGIAEAVQAVLGKFPALSITSTTSGNHVAGSYHYKGEAADISADGGTMFHASDWIKRSNLYRSLTEGIHNPNLSVNAGHMVPSSFYAGVWAGHANHIHLAVAGALRAFAGGAGAGGTAGAQQIGELKVPRDRVGGAPGALAHRAGEIYAHGLREKINKRLEKMAGGVSGAGFSGGSSKDAQANMRLGHKMMLAAGWGEDQWPALRSLFMQESGWLPQTNPSSGAYGIPQALGHGHPFDIGDIPAQIAWGLNYIRGRYGSPAGAWSHEQRSGWYSRGGPVAWAGAFANGGSFTTNGPTAFIAGEGHRRRERVTVTPANATRTGPVAGAGGHGAVHVVFERGSIVVAGDTSEEQATKVAEMVANKLITAIDKKTAGVVS